VRPRLCYVCGAPAVIVVQRQRHMTVIRLDGTVQRGLEAVGRYLCADHEHLDPWEG
jgi:hypothetical protein